MSVSCTGCGMDAARERFPGPRRPLGYEYQS
jgi:hypothetical protein